MVGTTKGTSSYPTFIVNTLSKSKQCVWNRYHGFLQRMLLNPVNLGKDCWIPEVHWREREVSCKSTTCCLLAVRTSFVAHCGSAIAQLDKASVVNGLPAHPRS